MENTENDLSRVKRQKTKTFVKMEALEAAINKKSRLISDIKAEIKAGKVRQTVPQQHKIIASPDPIPLLLPANQKEVEVEKEVEKEVEVSVPADTPTVLEAGIAGSAQQLYNALLQKHLRAKLLNKYDNVPLKERKAYALEAQQIKSLNSFIYDKKLAVNDPVNDPVDIEPKTPIVVLQKPVEIVKPLLAETNTQEPEPSHSPSHQLDEEMNALAKMKREMAALLKKSAKQTDQEMALKAEVQKRSEIIKNINKAIEKILLGNMSPNSQAQAYVPRPSKTYTSTPNKPKPSTRISSSYIIPKEEPKKKTIITNEPKGVVTKQPAKKARITESIRATSTPAPSAYKLTKPVTSTSMYKDKGFLNWPIKRPTVVSRYGQQKHPNVKNILINNKGIDIISTSTSVLSVHDGLITVVKEVSEGKYTIILQHDESYHSVYSNIELCRVKQGERVGRGQLLGAAKEMANGTAKLHFEIWRGKHTENPLHWLRDK